ncbi:putative MFS aflatoxin efflux pump [Xylariaceae sp. FL0804]|nr:putative MFS aflatoxin efflux pump [Xylariaceae sp. FL0804]
MGVRRPSNEVEMSPMPSAGDDDATAQGEPVQRLSTGEVFEYPTGLRLALLLSSVYISIFLVSLDRLIISTAIPAITDEFHSLQDVGWYASAYLLTTCAFQLLYGKLYKFFSIRPVYMASVGLFEVGSAICGAAPNSVAFIIGRAVQGVGSAGIFSGGIVVLVYALPLHRRPFFQGLFGAVFGISSVLGPLVGGAFTTNVTWRWCFYINLPFGGIALVAIGFLLRVPDRVETKLSLKAKLSQLDAAGTGVLIPGVVSLLLALQWGGLTYPWNSGRIIALLTLGIALLIGFCCVQAFMPATATVSPRIFKQRSVLGGFCVSLFIGSSQMIFVYYLPIWFQAIEGVSAVNSGIRLLPLTLAMVVASISNGIIVSKIGYYTPSLLVGLCIMITGAGLLTTLHMGTEEGNWIGYQILYGFGMGCAFQAPNLAAQTVLPKEDVPIGTSLMFFSQIIGGAIFTSVGENVLNNQLLQRLSGLPGFEPSMVESTGATTLASSLPANLLQPILTGYNDSLRVVFIVGLVLGAVTIPGALAIEWRSVKEHQPGSGPSRDAESGGQASNRQETGEEGRPVSSDTETLSDASAARAREEKARSTDDDTRNPAGAAKQSTEL